MAESSSLPDAAAAAVLSSPLRYPRFRNLIGGMFLFTVAIQIQEVVLGYQLYVLTHDPLVLGLIGLAEAVPFLLLALFGGHYADRFDKRRIMCWAMAFVAVGSAVLLWATLPVTGARIPQAAQLGVIYGVIAAFGLARGFFTPASGSLTAFLVPREHLARASAWRSTAWQSAAILGPMCAGFLYAGIGMTATLGLVIALTLAGLAMAAAIGPQPPRPRAGEAELSIWQSLREGIDFVIHNRIILYSISLDLFSVLFGGVVAILPIFATDILKVGPQGLGIMRTAPAVGAVLTLLACARVPPTQHAWRNLLLAVTGFGLATLVFAWSQSFWLSVAALFATGAFDAVSVVIRGTLLQVLPPDHLRGRVIAVNSVFIGASNELGAFESGLAAKLMGTVSSVILGGALTLATVLYVWRRSKELFAVRLS